MKNERIRVVDLAKELHVSPRLLVQTAHKLNINVLRGTALLHSGQVHQLRQYYKNMRATHAPHSTPSIASPPSPRRRHDELRPSMCVCCEYMFMRRPEGESRELCKDCRAHFKRDGEPQWQTVVRLEDHVKKSREMVNSYREAANSASKERDLAYEKRNKWMAALVEIVVAHGPDEEGPGCSCGSTEFPCLTRRHLAQVNRGIFNRCEELEGMNEDEFNKVLYGIDYSHFTDWDDGVA
ncbi:hypothetical protein GCM10009821_07470 [Aeromicrobium halocynthiae]|uniref:Translation initiation factor IF-2 N-terminal domain-containing protein n=1 Tax=Aeromicrobium halocynthiae TaxID=560557 RepID=A0ABN2VUE1_9ACTN